MDAGTVRAGLLEDKATVIPAAGAAVDIVKKQKVAALEDRLEFMHVRELTLIELTTREMVTGDETPLREAVMVPL
jgi:hypothetical protein